MEPKVKKFTVRIKGGEACVIHATDEGAALRSLVRDARIPYSRVTSISCEDVKDVEPTFVIQIGPRDYTTIATNALTALTAFAKMGLDMSKAKNLRRR